MRLAQLNAANRLDDVRLPSSNRLEALKHDRNGQYDQERFAAHPPR